MTIIGLSVDTTFRFTKLLPQARDLAFGRAYAASAVASADGSPLLFSIGGEHAEGWVYDTVVAYTVNASRVESGMYNSSDALWVQKASLAEPRWTASCTAHMCHCVRANLLQPHHFCIRSWGQ